MAIAVSALSPITWSAALLRLIGFAEALFRWRSGMTVPGEVEHPSNAYASRDAPCSCPFTTRFFIRLGDDHMIPLGTTLTPLVAA
jgi:hypothetical protein